MTLPQAATPSRQQGLLLEAALFEGDEAVEAWEEWKRLTGGIEQHDHVSYQVIPLLYRRLAPLAPDDPDLQRLKGVYRHTWYVNQRKLHAAADVLSDLERAGIPTLLLKGAALIAGYYRDAGVRPMTDFDVLVPRARQADAFARLAELGWSTSTEVSPAKIELARHSLSFFRGDQELDLHWNVLRYSSDDSAFWDASTPLTIRDAHTRALSPADQLVHTIVHGTGYWGGPVDWIADSHTVIRSAGDALDWQRVVDRAAALEATLRTTAALTFLRDAFRTDVPAAVLQKRRVGTAERLEFQMLSRYPETLAARFVRRSERWRRTTTRRGLAWITVRAVVSALRPRRRARARRA